MAKSYAEQPICPTDGGLLLSHPDWGDMLWCPSNGHGGNGRFYRPGEYDRGVPATYRRVLTPSTGKPPVELKDATPKPKPPPRPAKEPRACGCDCGGMTKGGRFLPGHDARYHARMKREGH